MKETCQQYEIKYIRMQVSADFTILVRVKVTNIRCKSDDLKNQDEKVKLTRVHTNISYLTLLDGIESYNIYTLEVQIGAI